MTSCLSHALWGALACVYLSIIGYVTVTSLIPHLAQVQLNRTHSFMQTHKGIHTNDPVRGPKLAIHEYDFQTITQRGPFMPNLTLDVCSNTQRAIAEDVIRLAGWSRRQLLLKQSNQSVEYSILQELVKEFNSQDLSIESNQTERCIQNVRFHLSVFPIPHVLHIFDEWTQQCSATPTMEWTSHKHMSGWDISKARRMAHALFQQDEVRVSQYVSQYVHETRWTWYDVVVVLCGIVELSEALGEDAEWWE
jgi:hypothetical protein